MFRFTKSIKTDRAFCIALYVYVYVYVTVYWKNDRETSKRLIDTRDVC